MTVWAISRAKLQLNRHHQQTPTPSFLQAGCPSCHPTNSVKALKGLIDRRSKNSAGFRPISEYVPFIDEPACSRHLCEHVLNWFIAGRLIDRFDWLIYWSVNVFSISDEVDTVDSSNNNDQSTTEDLSQSTLKIRLTRCQYQRSLPVLQLSSNLPRLKHAFLAVLSKSCNLGLRGFSLTSWKHLIKW